MSEHGLEALLALVFFGLIILILWTSFWFAMGPNRRAQERARAAELRLRQ
jgi:hypothetical protein